MKPYIKLYCCILLFGASSIFAGMDDARLKERLIDGALLRLLTEEYFYSGITGETDEHSHSELKEVSDEQFHRVLIEIYNEAEEKRPILTPNTVELGQNRDMVVGVLVCLPMCGDIQIKGFLLDYAASIKNDQYVRSVAVLSYLRVADADEAKNVLLRFLVGKERMDDYARSSIYVVAKDVWDVSSPDKKAAIFHALCEAASSESPQWVFEECDSRLLLMDTVWRDSPQRESMLRRQLSLPFSKYYTELKSQMEKEIERIKIKNNNNIMNTNPAALATRDFSLPKPDLLTNEVTESNQEGSGAEPETTVSLRGTGPGQHILFGMLALLLLGFGTWRFMRK